jgi:hypothetical protein
LAQSLFTNVYKGCLEDCPPDSQGDLTLPIVSQVLRTIGNSDNENRFGRRIVRQKRL